MAPLLRLKKLFFYPTPGSINGSESHSTNSGWIKHPAKSPPNAPTTLCGYKIGLLTLNKT